MPILIDGSRKTTKGLKVGRSIEEVILKRRLNIDNPLTWPPGQNTSLKALKHANRLTLEICDELFSPNFKPVILSNDDAIHHNQKLGNINQDLDTRSNESQSYNQYQNQTSEYNSMANYCQTLRYRIKVR